MKDARERWVWHCVRHALIRSMPNTLHSRHPNATCWAPCAIPPLATLCRQLPSCMPATLFAPSRLIFHSVPLITQLHVNYPATCLQPTGCAKPNGCPEVQLTSQPSKSAVHTHLTTHGSQTVDQKCNSLPNQTRQRCIRT